MILHATYQDHCGRCRLQTLFLLIIIILFFNLVKSFSRKHHNNNNSISAICSSMLRQQQCMEIESEMKVSRTFKFIASALEVFYAVLC